MCGIVGSITPNKLLSADRKRSALSLIQHRGPDAKGEFQDISSGLWFGHVRLAILDLSDAGAQPMTLEDDSFVLTFNGEIYNYRQIRNELMLAGIHFKSESDTEVLLQAWNHWGEKCLSRLQGMFAFAIWEKKANRVFLARDRAGEKPLYYSQQGNSFFFSSEIPALKLLLDHPMTPDPMAVQRYLENGYITGENTSWKGISKLLTGRLLTYSMKSHAIEIISYREREEIENSHAPELPVEELNVLMGEVVKDQLVADVPVGLMLSGGLDSSLLASYVSELSNHISAFTVVFPGFEHLDESRFAKEISNHFGLTHEQISCDQVQVSDWLKTMESLESPISDPAFYPTYLMSKAIKTQCKVALGGDGADEVFGGYERYSKMIELKKKADRIPFVFRKLIGSAAADLLPIGAKGRHSLMELGQDMRFGPPDVPSLFLRTEIKRLLKPEFHSWVSQQEAKLPTGDIDTNWIDQLLKRDFDTYLPDNILTKVDRASMLASLEVRAPFLDKRILDFASRLSSDWKVNETERKVILKRLAEKRLPKHWNMQRKQGFVPPLHHWLKEKEWQDLIHLYLLGSDSFFEPNFIHKLLNGQEKGRFNKRRIYALLVLAIHLKNG
jgi:asparagine synthase (glutamine-hydrolysing)